MRVVCLKCRKEGDAQSPWQHFMLGFVCPQCCYSIIVALDAPRPGSVCVGEGLTRCVPPLGSFNQAWYG